MNTSATICGSSEPRASSPVVAAREPALPAKSRQRQKAAGAALAAKRGDVPKSRLKGASKSMAEAMDVRGLRDMAEARRSELLRHDSKARDGKV